MTEQQQQQQCDNNKESECARILELEQENAALRRQLLERDTLLAQIQDKTMELLDQFAERLKADLHCSAQSEIKQTV